MTLEEVRIKTIFDIAKIQSRKSNDCKGPPRSQRNPKGGFDFMKISTLNYFRGETKVL